MARRPSRSKKPKQSAWEIYRLKGARAAFVGRLKGSPTAFVGVVYAEDEEGAIAVAIEEHNVRRPISGGYSRDHTNDNPPLPAVVNRRGNGRLLHREGSHRALAGVRLFRGGAGAALGGTPTDPRRGPPDRGQHRQAPGVVTAVTTASLRPLCKKPQLKLKKSG